MLRFRLASSELPVSPASLAPEPLALMIPALVTCISLLASCSAPEPEPVETGPVVVESAAANLSFEGVPEGFDVTQNDGAGFVLSPSSPEATGRMWVEAGEVSDFGIDLVAITNQQKAIYEALPGGSFSGSRKLVTQMGEAYYSRGQFDGEDGVRQEEVRVHAIHPVENRLVTLYYRYPAGDDANSSTRISQLLDLVGRIQSAAPATSEPTPE